MEDGIHEETEKEDEFMIDGESFKASSIRRVILISEKDNEFSLS